MATSAIAVMAQYLEADGAAALDWQKSAACRGANDTPYFAEGRTSHAVINTCRACPVMDECRQYALDRPWIAGIWGATTAPERDRIRRGLPESDALEVRRG